MSVSPVNARSSNFQFAFADRLEALDPIAWDLVTADAPVFLTRGYLLGLQAAGPETLLHRYGLVFRGPDPVAAVALQVVELCAGQFARNPEEVPEEDKGILGLGRLTKAALEKLKRRVMVCGNMASFGPHGVAVRAGEDSAEIWPAVAELMDRLRRADKPLGSVDYLVMKEIPEPEGAPDARGMAGLRDLGYRPMVTEPDMILDLDPSWESYDDYLGGMTKKYRKAARTISKKVEAASIEVVDLPDLRGNQERMYELYQAVASRSQFQLVEFPANFFVVMAESIGPDRFAATGLIRDGQLVGFVTMLKDAGQTHGYFLGVDYDANADAPIYHRLLHAVIEKGLEWRSPRVAFGGTALDAKARLGCQPVTMTCWVRHRVPLLNFLVRPLFGMVPTTEVPERNAMKPRD